MPNCTICSAPNRAEIDSALVASQGYRAVAKRFGLSAPSVYRHQRAHIPQVLAKAHQAAELVQADGLLESIRGLHERTLKILRDAEETRQHAIALKAIKEARCNLELLARLSGELEAAAPGNTTVQIVYVDQTIGRSMTDGPAPRLIEAKSYLNAGVSETPLSTDNK